MFKFNLVFLLSRSPIFSISVDKCFHKVDSKNDLHEKTKFRYSLISLGFGNTKIYLITINGGKFKFFDKIKFDDVITNPELDLASKSDSYYISYLTSYSDTNKRVDIEFLKYQIQVQTERISTSKEKMNIYNAVIVLFISILITVLIASNTLHKSLLYIIALIVSIYLLINSISWTTQFLEVKAINKSSFGTLKNSTSKVDELAKSYYFDWQNLSYFATLSVGYVKNLEYYIKLMYKFLIILLSIFVSFQAYSYSNQDDYTNHSKNIILESEQLDQIENVQKILRNNTQNTILILNHDSSNLTERKIIDNLALFNIDNDIIKLIDKTNNFFNMNSDTERKMQIIILEEEI